MSKSSYSDFYEYRRDVAFSAIKQLHFFDHDFNNDSIIDVMFIIASNNNIEKDFLLGGAIDVWNDSDTRGINTFVDEQNSLSIQYRAIGNFSHEMGHNFGLPDIYGAYDNMHYFSIMSDSWAVPPHTFSAYEKVELGWVIPQTITESVYDYLLTPGEIASKVIKINTDNEEDYFLLEYRQKQSKSYASSAYCDYNGIAIYHVRKYALDWNNEYPPLCSILSADGNDYFGGDIVPPKTILWYPENIHMADTCNFDEFTDYNCGFLGTDFKYSDTGMTISIIKK